MYKNMKMAVLILTSSFNQQVILLLPEYIFGLPAKSFCLCTIASLTESMVFSTTICRCPKIIPILLKQLKYKRACRRNKISMGNKIAAEVEEAIDNKNLSHFWEQLKMATNKNQHTDGPTMSVLHNHFKNLNESMCEDSFDETFKKHVENNLNIILKGKQTDDILDRFITEKEIKEHISKMKNRKAPGNDLITSEMLKAAGNIILKPLCILFNEILNTSSYPTSWAEGNIVPIYKSGDVKNPTNYRGITVSSSLGKLFATILNTRLLSFLDKNNVITEEQIGFRVGNRTTDHVTVIKSLIDNYKHRKKKIYACYIDFSKAFDRIWRPGLLLKLRNNHISSKFINLLNKMYNQLECRVKLSGELSSSFKSHIGTRQGCPLSATLYNIYTNDLPKILKNNKCKPVKLNKTSLNCLMYADDIVVLSETSDGLQKALKLIDQFCCRWRLKINTDKSKVMIFNNRKEKMSAFLNNTLLEQANKYCYLGVILTPTGSFLQTLEYLHDKATRAYFSIHSSLKRIQCFSVQTYLKIFNSVIIPILTYSSELWGAYFKRNGFTSLNNLFKNESQLIEKLHNRFCKTILKVKKTTSVFACRAELGQYPIIINILNKMLSYNIYIQKEQEHTCI